MTSTFPYSSLSRLGTASLRSATTASLSHLLQRPPTFGTEDRIVLDIGSLYIKVGFGGEPRPRHIISFREFLHQDRQTPSDQQLVELYNQDLMRENNAMERVEFMLGGALQDVYFRYLLADPSQHKVIICESPMIPIKVKEIIASILFHRFHIPTISFLPNHLLALLTTGKMTGLVIDCGHLETIVLPISFAIPLSNALKTTPLAGRAVASRLKELLKNHASIIDASSHSSISVYPHRQVLDSSLTSELIQDIQLQCLFVSPTGADGMTEDIGDSDNKNSHANDVYYRLKGKDGILVIPGWVREHAAEILFSPIDEELCSIGECVLDAVLKVPRDLRRELISSILLIGGSSMMAGFQTRLHNNLVGKIKLAKYSKICGLLPSINFFDISSKSGQVFPRNSRAWVGGSLVGALQLSGQAVNREQFDGSVPDWTRPML
ncbi:actin family [Phycomyces blakesleeanus]|uniref:Uncharacterized protein n=2 Tax=Phycomyces blakesleeanus TaxID=4837 RepID=A0A162NI42_PHYB8|nr:hypothetical protein PHYBLDRAFT_70458 [Phycomyces blakesleeanus NRRL 1555(-)]OAD69884.1 hypothetical protein PHYBLDRAFT_70458 [Phycomyces blakesleeanus NRRL 1555(-)]|eukprot:XP_018287924.1 hypothetical protein PHYBLDRAFT_70458 [Phycomyces blakesleeanus NRRL 1555(-)]